ncbi:MAG: hypothetical protein ACTSUY_01675, partial [Alphaproteobacteria bacterium]
ADSQILNQADPQQVSAYVLDMTLALRNVASNAGLDFLAYLLDMAAEESLDLSRRTKASEIMHPAATPVRKIG